MTRPLFGGTDDDRVEAVWQFGQRKVLTLSPGTRVRFYDAETGGNEVTDLTSDEAGTTPLEAVVTDDQGYLPSFYPPEGYLRLWGEATGSTRRRLVVTQGRQGPPGEPGEPGPPGAPGGSDAAFAGWVADDTSETSAALKATIATGQPLNAEREGVPTAPTNAHADYATFLSDSAAQARRAHFPDGTYLVGTGTNPTVNLAAGARWALSGEVGAVVKMADGAVAADWTTPLIVQANGTGDVDRVDISGISFDGNRRGQTLPPGDFDWEHAALVRLGGSSGSRLQYVSLRDLDFRDPIADCVWSNTFYLDTLVVQGMRVRDRAGTRSDLQLSGLPRVTQVSDFVGNAIEFESSTPPADITHDFLIQMDQVSCSGRFDLGVTEALAGRVKVNLAGIHANETFFSRLSGTVADSEFHFSRTTSRTLYYLADIEFSNCDFYIYSDAVGVVAPLTFYPAAAYPTSAKFHNCRFHLVPDPAYAGSTFSGPALQINTSTAVQPVSPNDEDVYEFENCWWDERFERDISSSAYMVRLTNNDYGATSQPIRLIGSVSYETHLRVRGGSFERCPGGFLHLGPTAKTSVHLDSIAQDAANGSVAGVAASLLPDLNTRSNRVIYVDAAPPASGLRGDIARLKSPVAGSTYEWVCTASSYTAATWKALTTAAA